MPDRHITAAPITKIAGDKPTKATDQLATEEPLEIKLEFGSANNRQQKSLSVTMRTPGNDFELASGFLFTEGIIHQAADIQHIQYCASASKTENRENVVRVRLHPQVMVHWEKLQRHFYTSSSCGVCGKSSIEAVKCYELPPLPENQPQFEADLIHQLPELLRYEQEIFDSTGGLHAAALFDKNGKMPLLCEDVGRHNALDKLIGKALQKNLLPLHQFGLLVSGRASFELVQKAVMAGIPLMAAVGAPSSLAVQLAQSTGMTLLGFVRNHRFNIYSGENRILLPSHSKKLTK